MPAGGVHDPTALTDRVLVMQQALARLTSKQRAVLVLRFYEDLSERARAEVLGVGTGTVKSQTFAALRLGRLRGGSPAPGAGDRPHNLTFAGLPRTDVTPRTSQPLKG